MTALDPDPFKINRALKSAKGFDHLIVHLDRDTKSSIVYEMMGDNRHSKVWEDNHLSIPEAYNLLISRLEGNPWICCFCDDDFFDPKGLENLIAKIRKNEFNDYDIIHFRVHVSGIKQYHEWGAAEVNGKNLLSGNPIPAGSFFRKSAWEKAGGFRGLIWHDWCLWLRAYKAGCKFGFFPETVYWFMTRENSAQDSQLKIFDGDIEKAKASVIQYAE